MSTAEATGVTGTGVNAGQVHTASHVRTKGDTEF